ncbi:MAG: type I 3-dehydroquinate dehydratase [Eubacterium sp.]|nr:type I 3-dehydroquinate dehydratase [Eubacterium sp.]
MRIFNIKGITFGEGRPVICIPVIKKEKDEIIAKIIELAQRGVQMIEWRSDAFADVDQPQQVSEILAEVKPYLDKTVFLFTFRTKQQGGTRSLEEKKILYLNELAAKSGAIDMLDLEFFEATRPEKEIRRFQKMGVKIIASHHDFEGTPDERILHMLMDQMEAGGADVAKLAMMPNSYDDVVRMIKLTNDTREHYPNLPIVTMSMGPYGVITRICGEAFGSCITFGADGEASAPGQMQADKLKQILDWLHESMTD